MSSSNMSSSGAPPQAIPDVATVATDKAGAGQRYRVLARKYRPSTFAELVGQETLVRILTNAITLGRLAHAFMLTGERGVGKTTTARIIARALNCEGDHSGKASVEETTDGPVTEPCGVCDNCIAIAEDRHMDVLEIDAASNSRVDDIRELIDGVRYRPSSARYKVYIIDEVHMLSKNAFNALLKTLEEPPECVKFIFATTEIRKIPITVLSRCQRFDLRRVEEKVLEKHFEAIIAKENARVEQGAVRLIARAADGSVRDGLSLLDQALSGSDDVVTETQVRTMMGLSDRTRSFDLLEMVLAGKPVEALTLFEDLYNMGVNPARCLEDLLDVVHWLSRVRITPKIADDPTVPETERTQGVAMAQRLSVPILSRCWQMLLKGLAEVRDAPHAVRACEMVLLRITHVASMPTPEELATRWEHHTPAPDNQAVAPAQTSSQESPQAGQSSVGQSSADMSSKVQEVLETFPGAEIVKEA